MGCFWHSACGTIKRPDLQPKNECSHTQYVEATIFRVLPSYSWCISPTAPNWQLLLVATASNLIPNYRLVSFCCWLHMKCPPLKKKDEVRSQWVSLRKWMQECHGELIFVHAHCLAIFSNGLHAEFHVALGHADTNAYWKHLKRRSPGPRVLQIQTCVTPESS